MLLSPQALHIPDGFLTPLVAGIGWLLAVGMITIALRLTGRQLGERQVPLMGVLGAFIFAAQSINFPVAAGTSGHLLGAALAAITVGPWAASLVMTAVVVVQALLFQDGGLLVMGWNIINMAVISVFAGYAGFRLMRRLLGDRLGANLAGAFLGGWLATEAGAIATAFELAASGSAPINLALPAMVSVHALIGIGEALITSAAVGVLQTSRPQILQGGDQIPGRRAAWLVVAGTLLALGVAMLSPFASTRPDGLEFVAEQQGFLGLRAAGPLSLLLDYTIPDLTNPVMATMLAVGLGTMVVLVLSLLIGRSRLRRG